MQITPAPRTAAEFQDAPWREVKLGQIGPAKNVPVMLSNQERKLYYWLTSEWMRGVGDVAELGTFVGGSTAHLAAGHEVAGHAGKIHMYDRFTSDAALKERMFYRNGIAHFEGEDILPLSQVLLAPWADRLVWHKGEIQDGGWDGGPLEVLVVDAFKNAGYADKMTADFFPSLIPGQSVVVHQDFLHWSQPWIAAQMVLFGDAFEPVAFVPEDTLVFLCKKRIDGEMLRKAAVAELGDAEILRALETASEWLGHNKIRTRLAEAADGLRQNPGVRTSWLMSR